MAQSKSDGCGKFPGEATPMGKIIHLVKNWERNKRMLIELRKDPVAFASFLKSETPEDFSLDAMDSLVAAAREAVSAWLLYPDEAANPPVAHDALAVLKLWESFLAARELCNGDQRALWLSQKSNEEQLLIARLSKALSLN